MRNTVFIFGVLMLMMFIVKTNARTNEKSEFRRGVECSVYWQKSKCGPKHKIVRN